jgi:hypothetical protein
MTIIKNHFEVFILTSKKQGNGIIESIKCQLRPRFRVRNSTLMSKINYSLGFTDIRY